MSGIDFIANVVVSRRLPIFFRSIWNCVLRGVMHVMVHYFMCVCVCVSDGRGQRVDTRWKGPPSSATGTGFKPTYQTWSTASGSRQTFTGRFALARSVSVAWTLTIIIIQIIHTKTLFFNRVHTYLNDIKGKVQPINIFPLIAVLFILLDWVGVAEVWKYCP